MKLDDHLKKKIKEIAKEEHVTLNCLSIGLNCPPSYVNRLMEEMLQSKWIYEVRPGRYSSRRPENYQPPTK